MFDKKIKSPFYQYLEDAVKVHGGLLNAHLHLDRAGTFAAEYLQGADVSILEDFHISLKKKHDLIGDIHSGLAYQPNDLKNRVQCYIDSMVESGTRRADTMVDVTADNVGLDAMDALLEIKKQCQEKLDLRVAAYTPMGFSDRTPENWEIYVEGAKRADFIGALPERDDQQFYADNIGFYESCKRTLLLALELGKEVHVHTDQRNEPSEKGTEDLVRAVKEFGAPSGKDGEPGVWAVHVVSPSTYEDDRFEKLLADLVECNIGVICCPSAAIGMRQIRTVSTPTYNSIPRVLEMLAAGVNVRLGSDNVADICSPSTTENLFDEIFILSAALRFYDARILAKVACGIALDSDDRALICSHLEKNNIEISNITRKLDLDTVK